MRIGIAQIDTTPGVFDETVERMVAQSLRAAEQGVEFLAFPLAALAGVDELPYADRLSFSRDLAAAVDALAERLACPALVPIPVDQGDLPLAFDVLLIEQGTVRPLRMGDVPTGEGAAPETEMPQFSFGGLRWALALSHAELDALDDYDYDVDGVLFVSGYPFAADDSASAMAADLVNARFASDAQTTGAWLVGVAALGGYGDQVFTGSSFVLAPSGELVASAPAFEEALLVADVGPDAVPAPATALPPEVFDLPLHLWEAVTLGIRDFAAKHGYSDVALCLDGTLDAQVLLALASDALGPLHVHALVGASAGQAAPSCRELARRLRVDCEDALGQLHGIDARAMDELQLAELARRHGALPLASQDKTALALGAACDVSAALLCPLGDIYRSDVLDMAHLRNTISPLFRRVGLGERDALELPLRDGTAYQVADERAVSLVDEVLLGYVEYDRPLAELAAGGATPLHLVDAVLRAERAAELRRRSLPPVLAMSTHTLDDARFPLGVRWHDAYEDVLELPQDVRGTRQGTSHEQGERGMPAPHEDAGATDLQGTLALLRDLAEQGGFDPEVVATLEQIEAHPEEMQQFEKGSGKMPWMSPFSEN